jgi:hypothetical protein
MTTTRKSASAVGGLFLIATASYLIGNALIASALSASNNLSNVAENPVRTGVLLEFVDAAAAVGIGVLLFPILRQHREALALGYAGTRIIESALILVSAVFALLLLPVGQEITRADAANAAQLQTLGALIMAASNLAFQLAMIALGAGSLLLCYILYEVRLVPRALSALGVVGYLALFASGWLQIAGNNVASVLYVPGALFELIFPLWLIVKGLNEPYPIYVDRPDAVVGATRHVAEPARTHSIV